MGVKEAYLEKANAQLCEWQAWIEQYTMGSSQSGYLHKVDHNRYTEQLGKCYRVARVYLDNLQEAPEDRWEFSKQAVERAMIDLKRLLDDSGAAQNARYLTLQTSRSYAYGPFQRKG